MQARDFAARLQSHLESDGALVTIKVCSSLLLRQNLNAHDKFDIYNVRGQAYSMEGELEKAIADFDQARSYLIGDRDPSARLYINRSNVYLKLKNFKEAIYDADAAALLIDQSEQATKILFTANVKAIVDTYPDELCRFFLGAEMFYERLKKEAIECFIKAAVSAKVSPSATTSPETVEIYKFYLALILEREELRDKDFHSHGIILREAIKRDLSPAAKERIIDKVTEWKLDTEELLAEIYAIEAEKKSTSTSSHADILKKLGSTQLASTPAVEPVSNAPQSSSAVTGKKLKIREIDEETELLFHSLDWDPEPKPVQLRK